MFLSSPHQESKRSAWMKIFCCSMGSLVLCQTQVLDMLRLRVRKEKYFTFQSYMQRKQSNKEQSKWNTKAGEQELPFVKGLIVICLLLDVALDKTLGFLGLYYYYLYTPVPNDNTLHTPCLNQTSIFPLVLLLYNKHFCIERISFFPS